MKMGVLGGEKRVKWGIKIPYLEKKLPYSEKNLSWECDTGHGANHDLED
jgi:hypothetical protein